MSEQITNIIISIAPSVITIFTFIGVIAKVISSFTKLKKEVVDMKCVKDLNSKMDEVLEENRMLKRKLNETMTLIDRVERKD